MLILNDTYIDMVLIDVVFYVLETILKMLLHLLNQLTIFVCKEKGKRREREGKEKGKRGKRKKKGIKKTGQQQAAAAAAEYVSRELKRLCFESNIGKEKQQQKSYNYEEKISNSSLLLSLSRN